MDDHEIIPGATPTPEQQQGQVPVAPPLLQPLDWTIEDGDEDEDEDDVLEEDQEYWENSKVRRLMEGGDGQDET